MNQFLINEEQIKEINKLAFRNFGNRIAQILNNLNERIEALKELKKEMLEEKNNDNQR